ncbi:MAG: tryptophan-rich sensory protein [Patescibacteria group bacterium]|nr:tryptophan-rich sensory protein [Patescibacteria group bacterium]
MKIKPNYIIIPLVTFAIGWLGSYFTGMGMDWYDTLKLPAFAPPGWVIGAAWTVIYILSTISLLIAWNKFPHDAGFRMIAVLFIINGFLNAFWCVLWFAWHLMGLAILEMIFLEATVIAIMIMEWPRSRAAAWLMLPYAGWVAFATFLAINVWRLN